MLNKPLISVILPTYNPSDYIFDCFRSLNQQDFSFDNFEVIIVLNGDKYPYKEMLADKLHEYSFNYNLIYSENKGVSIARNIGLDYSKGDYIAFIDDDDYVSDNYLSDLYRIANDESIAVCEVVAFGNKSSSFFLDNYLHKHHENVIFELARFRSILSVPWAKLIPRSVIGMTRFKVGITNGEDALFVTSCTAGIKYLCCSKKASYYVRMREGSASRRKVSFVHLCHNTVLLLYEYLKVFMSKPHSYSVKLFAARFPGVIKNFFILLNNN